MRKSRITDEQVVGIIRETDMEAVAEVAKRHGVSEQTIYTWSKRFGELRTNDVRRLRQLETKNARLKELLAERDTTVVFAVSLPPEMADDLERVRRREHQTRSELIREALRRYFRLRPEEVVARMTEPQDRPSVGR